MSKTEMDVEKLLHWAYRDELSKRQTSSAEGIWDRIETIGERGGVDTDHGAAQRYSHVGLPDPDAEAIELAVAALEDRVIDWKESLGPLAGPLAGLVSVNDFSRRPIGDLGRKTVAGWTDKRTGKWRESESRPRDMLMLGTFRPKALVTMFAIQGRRPDWCDEDPRPYQVQAAKGPHAKVVGDCEGKNRYSLGAFCPLQWEPSPVSVITARAEYAVWLESLHELAASLVLAKFIALPPRAPAAPWFGEVEVAGEVVRSPSSAPSLHLPLAPTRERMLSPYRRTPTGPVRYPLDAPERAGQ